MTLPSEQQLDAMFGPGCDPYRAGAAALFAKSPATVADDERDLVKRVFKRIAHARGMLRSEPETSLSPLCTGTLVHDEFTACPVHDGRDR